MNFRPLQPRLRWNIYTIGMTLILFTTASTAQQEGRPSPGQVVVSGTLPDEASKAAILSRLQAVYGGSQVVDHMSLGKVVSPPHWSQDMARMLGPALKAVSKGQLVVEGTRLRLSGQVANEAQRQAVASQLAAALGSDYVIQNALRVSADEQALLDQTLAGRVIEFEHGSALLTETGREVLEEMLAALQRIPQRRVEVVGHTDSAGARGYNLALSRARAEAVRTYLIERGLGAERILASGLGPDQPLASNDTEDGRQRNRRIEFRVLN